MWYLYGILSQEQEEDGFVAFEDEDFLYIKRYGEICLVFSRSGATRESIWEAVESVRKGSRLEETP